MKTFEKEFIIVKGKYSILQMLKRVQNVSVNQSSEQVKRSIIEHLDCHIKFFLKGGGGGREGGSFAFSHYHLQKIITNEELYFGIKECRWGGGSELSLLNVVCVLFIFCWNCTIYSILVNINTISRKYL